MPLTPAIAEGVIADLRTPDRAPAWRTLMVVILLAAPVYGAFMGSFSLCADRALMIVYVAVKLPLLLAATTALCLPGYFVLSTVLGLRDDFPRAIRAILASQAALALALASLGPLTRLFYFSGATHRGALLFSALMFTLATAVGQVILLRHYRPLTAHPARGRRHRLMLWAWVVLYAFVGMQMGWMLRPFVGAPGLPVTFFRDEPFSNAYVVIVRLFFGG